MTDLTAKITELEEAVAEFKAQYVKYTAEDVNSAGSRARKALMVIKKGANNLRKTILTDQKAKKAERKAAKAAAAPTVAKTGKKGKKTVAADPTVAVAPDAE